ncbi:MAG: DNA gyrase inhibitor YacG [Filomicrobium sp.]
MADEQQKAATNDKPVDARVGTGRPCPICKSPSVFKYRPFCSRRCADVDLSRWMTGKYAVAGGDADEDEDGDQARAAEAVRSIAPRDSEG